MGLFLLKASNSQESRYLKGEGVACEGAFFWAGEILSVDLGSGHRDRHVGKEASTSFILLCKVIIEAHCKRLTPSSRSPPSSLLLPCPEGATRNRHFLYDLELLTRFPASTQKAPEHHTGFCGPRCGLLRCCPGGGWRAADSSGLSLLPPFQLHTGFWRGPVKGPAWLHSLGGNGNMSIKFHGNRFEGSKSGQRRLGSCGPRLGCPIDFQGTVASFPSCGLLGLLPPYLDSF